MDQNEIPDEKVYAHHNFETIRKLMRECYTPDSNNHSKVLDGAFSNIAKFCPKTFDGLSCWDETPAGTTATQNCPDFFFGFDPRRSSYKRCMENGTWQTHPQGNTPWTNYTTCVNVEDLDFRETIKIIYVAGYILSLISLLLSLAIFFYFRSLRCTRTRIHMHLFIAFAISNILWIFWYYRVVEQVIVVENNVIWCQILHIVTQYFTVSSYMWMFCEGLHLYMSLVIVFVREDIAMIWFKFIGWGVSFIIVMIYAIVRYNTPGATERCWMDNSDTFLIITIPIIGGLAASLGFLINVIRILMTKLRPNSNQDRTITYYKAARAALILIPLFGLHFIMIPMHPAPGAPGEQVYETISTILTSTQGLSVSVLFCFTNHEVKAAIRTVYARYFRGNEVIALAGVTAGESVPNTQEHVV